MTVHWDETAVLRRGTRTSVGLNDALLAYVKDAPFEEAVAALDWAAHTGVLDRVDFEELVLRLPQRLRGIGDWVDRACESYPESLARTRLRMHGLRVTSQVPVARVQRIDLVVEDVVGLEVDGEEFHRNRFLEDRNKDLDIALEGKQPFRISIAILNSRWDDVINAIELAITARGRALSRLSDPYPSANEFTRTRQIGYRGRLRLPPAGGGMGANWEY